jgi:hypothetical protein
MTAPPLAWGWASLNLLRNPVPQSRRHLAHRQPKQQHHPPPAAAANIAQTIGVRRRPISILDRARNVGANVDERCARWPR